MKTLIISTILILVLQCKGDVSGSINRPLPLNSLVRIPTPAQSLLPPTFENPIKDYTVGLLPPPVDKPLTRAVTRQNVGQHIHHPHPQTPKHIPATRFTNGFINTAGQSRSPAQQRSGYSTVYHQTHQSTNLVQPQVYQPKMAINQQYKQPTTHHHHHQHNQLHRHSSHSPGFVRQPAALHHSHVSTPQYYEPVSQGRVHQQHSTHTHYTPIPVQRTPTVVQHAHPSVQKPTFVPRTVSLPSASIIQTYPSVSYQATGSQHGSTLNFGNAKLDPELIHIISQVLGQTHS